MVNDFKTEQAAYDVAVIGGGPGGMAAAVSAARQGAKVVLVERLGYLGGQMASGLPFLAFLDMHKRQVVGGLAQKMVDDLAALEGTAGHHTAQNAALNLFWRSAVERKQIQQPQAVFIDGGGGVGVEPSAEFQVVVLVAANGDVGVAEIDGKYHGWCLPACL